MIKSIYYWGMCVVSTPRLYFNSDQRKDLEVIWDATLMPDNESSIIRFKNSLEVNRATKTYEELLEQRDNNWKKFCDKFVSGDTRLFITIPEQEHQMECDVKKFDLEKYLVYKSPLAVNRNYPEDGPKLRLWVFHKE